MDSSDYAVVSITGGVAQVRLRAPEPERSISLEALRGLLRVLRALDADPAVRAMVLSDAGNQPFGLGLEHTVDATRDGEAARRLRLLDSRWKTAVLQARTPTVAAIRGAAVDSSMELALACDIRFASTASTFAFSGIERGNLPGPVALRRLPAIVGQGVAADLLFSGRSVDALEAQRVGLVNYVCEPDRVLDSALDYARSIAGRSPLAIQGLKSALQQEDALLPAGLESAYQSLLAAACDEARAQAGPAASSPGGERP